MGSVDLVNILVDELGLSVDSLAFPLVCFDCEPMRLTSQCEDEGHGIGRETPLIAACIAGHVHVVEALCRGGANPNVQNEVSWTQNCRPCMSFWLGPVTHPCCLPPLMPFPSPLLSFVPVQEGRTALQCATAAGSPACVKVLMSHGADVTMANKVR